MRGTWFVVAFATTAVVLVGALASPPAGVTASAPYRVARIVDGDTLRLSNGERVRLLQIDAAEAGRCHAGAAREALRRLAPVGAIVTLEADPALDRVDGYGRLLRYVKSRGVNVNIRLVLEGAATPYFHRGERGKYADRLIAAAKRAQAAADGLWRSCPTAALGVAGTGRAGQGGGSAPRASAAGGGSCDPNYAQGCVPTVTYDLDCADLRAQGIAPVRVVGSDVHRFDGDGDGWGCE